MPTPNTTNSIQLSAISNLDIHPLSYIPTGTKDEAYDTLIAKGQASNSDIYLEASIPTGNGSYSSTKISLYQLINAIASYTRYVDHQNATSNDGFLKVTDETRTWKPRPSEGGVIIEPQLASNSDNNIEVCHLLQILANQGDSYIKGQDIYINKHGSIVFNGGIKKDATDINKCDNSLALWSRKDNSSTEQNSVPIIHIRSKQHVAFSTFSLYNEDQLITDENYQNFVYLTTGDLSLSSGNKILVSAGSNFDSNDIPIQLQSNNNNANTQCVEVLHKENSEKEIKCIATKAKWA